MIILDTNVLSELMLRAPDKRALMWLDRQPRLSVWTTSVTIFEIRFGLESMPAGKRQAALMRDLEKMLDSIDRRIAAFDVEAAECASALMASRKLQGRPREDRDTMIAGIVLARHATLATRNVAHFDDLSAPVVNPWTA
ncbi:MAG: type II toxin-antitoxin system VapC family toxin [Candidatus Sulfotelmatobacter sp.]|jgi:predicted nucleic acid-binding protein